MFLGILFLIFAAVVFFKIIGFFFRAAFGAGKLIFSLIFWPIVLLLLFFGIFKILLPLLIIGGIALLVIAIIRRASRGDITHTDRTQDPFRSQPRDYIDAEYREIK